MTYKYNDNYYNLEPEQGSILIVTIMILMLLTLIGTAALNITNSELLIARNEKLNAQAFYVAESGIEHGLANFDAGNTTDLINKEFADGNYSVRFDNSTNKYFINSTGQVESSIKKIQVTLVKPKIYPYNFGVFGNSSITVSGNPVVDSYNSTNGYVSGKNNGNIGVNSNSSDVIEINGNNAEIKGNAAIGPGGNINVSIDDKHDGIQGNKTVNNQLVPLPVVSSPCSGGSLGDFSLSSHSEANWGSSTYHYDSISLSSQSKINVSGQTIICVDNLKISGQAEINLASNAELKIYLSNSTDASGQGLVNQDGDPSALQIFGTSTVTNINLSGQADFYGTVYAPTANVNVTGQGDIYGSLVADNLTFSGQGDMHYDENLADLSLGTSGDWNLVSWQVMDE